MKKRELESFNDLREKIGMFPVVNVDDLKGLTFPKWISERYLPVCYKVICKEARSIDNLASDSIKEIKAKEIIRFFKSIEYELQWYLLNHKYSIEEFVQLLPFVRRQEFEREFEGKLNQFKSENPEIKELIRWRLQGIDEVINHCLEFE